MRPLKCYPLLQCVTWQADRRVGKDGGDMAGRNKKKDERLGIEILCDTKAGLVWADQRALNLGSKTMRLPGAANLKSLDFESSI